MSKKRSAAQTVDAMLEAHPYVTDRAGVTYRWNARFWEEATKDMLLHAAWRHGERAGNSSNYRREVMALLKARVLDEDLRWGQVGDGEVAVENGVVDVVTGRVREHRPEDYLEAVIPWAYDPAASCPVWLQCLEDWFGSADADAGRALQQFAGYVALPHARYKKALLIYGPGDTGKSVVLFMLRELVGLARCCKLSVEHMDDPVMVGVIKGKLLNVITEISARALVADGGFKALVSTEEPIELNRKWHPVETYVPICKHVISTNELPRLPGRTAEVFNRLLLVPMTRVVPPEARDPALYDKLRAEMPGILAWAVAGARDLVAQHGRFAEVSGAVDVLDEWTEDNNPMVQFVRENMRHVPYVPGGIPARTPVASVAEHWAGRPPAKQDLNRVSRWLRHAGFALDRQRPRDDSRGPVLCLMHYVWAPTEASQLDETAFRND